MIEWNSLRRIFYLNLKGLGRFGLRLTSLTGDTKELTFLLCCWLAICLVGFWFFSTEDSVLLLSLMLEIIFLVRVRHCSWKWKKLVKNKWKGCLLNSLSSWGIGNKNVWEIFSIDFRASIHTAFILGVSRTLDVRLDEWRATMLWSQNGIYGSLTMMVYIGRNFRESCNAVLVLLVFSI